MHLKLYYAPGACSFVPHVLLHASGAPFEPIVVRLHKGEQHEDAYRAVNPRGQVPVLVDDGEVITQILAIVTHLDARFPAMEFLPREPLARTRALETLAWMNNTVHPTFTHVFMPHKFTDDTQAQDALRRWNVQAYRKLLDELQSLVVRATATGLPWLGGHRLGPLDAYALTLLRWGTLAGIDPQGYPDLWAFVQRVAGEPSVARAIAQERLQLNLYKGE